MAWLTTKVLGYVSGGLLLALLLALAGWRMAALRADVAEAKLTAATSGLSACQAANTGWETTTRDMQSKLSSCQKQWDEAKTAAELAVAQAKTGWAKAEAERDAFADRWQRITGHCPTALEAMQTACADQIGRY